MAKLDRIELCHTYSYGVYDDSDSMTDYFNYTGHVSLRYLIERVKERGADQITVEVVNDDARIPHLARVKRIANEAGYTFQDKSCEREYNGPTDQKVKVWHIEYLLTRKPLKIHVTDYPLIASNGRPIRQATKVEFPNGQTVKFLDKLPKSEAIEQAEKLRYIQ